MERLLERFNMTECKPVKTPIEARVNSINEEGTECIVETNPYRELIRCLMYLMLYTRPDISAATNYYSRYQNRGTESHWNGLKQILRYIKGTLDYGLFFPRKKCDEPLLAYVDADWANDSNRKSITGYLIQVYGATVTWVTRKQATIALSSMESEYVALATAATNIIWFKKLLSDLGINCDEPVTAFDQSCIHLLEDGSIVDLNT